MRIAAFFIVGGLAVLLAGTNPAAARAPEQACMEAIARRFDQMNPAEMQARATKAGFTMKDYRAWWIAITAINECPSK